MYKTQGWEHTYQGNFQDSPAGMLLPKGSLRAETGSRLVREELQHPSAGIWAESGGRPGWARLLYPKLTVSHVRLNCSTAWKLQDSRVEAYLAGELCTLPY